MNNVGILTALAGGLISFVSPCVLPLVPPYLCYIGGVSIEELEQPEPGKAPRAASCPRRSPSCSASPPSSSRSARRRASSARRSPAIVRHARRSIGGILDHPAWACISSGSSAWRSSTARRASTSATCSPGCSAPMSSASPSPSAGRPASGRCSRRSSRVAGASDTVGEGAFLLFVYSLGLGIPFLARGLLRAALPLLARAASAATCRRSRKAWARSSCSPASLFLTGQMATVSYWMLETFPGLATLG